MLHLMHKPFNVLICVMVALMMGLSGCTVAGYTIAKQGEIEARIEKARAETAVQMEGLRQQELGLLKQVIAEHETRLQEAANHLFKGNIAFGMLKEGEISRTTRVMGQSIQLTATQLPPATALAQSAALKALQTELDETKIATAQLKAQYEAELDKARNDGAARVAALAVLGQQLQKVQEEKVTVLEKAGTTERALQAEKDKVQDKATADAVKDAADAANNQKLKLYLMAGLGVIALAAGAAAAFVPIPTIKRYGVILAVVAGGLAFAVPFITPFHALVAILCVGIPVVLRIVWVMKQDREDATDTYRAMNEVKIQQPELFKQTIAPILKSWHTNPDTSKRIDDRLKEVGDT